MRIVFLLGAGASADAGVPMMKDFFERANQVHVERPKLEEGAFELVGRGRAQLQVAQSKARLDLRNLESVFAAFEMGALFGGLGELSEEETKELPNAMRRVIVATIEHSMQMRVDSDKRILPPHPYGHFGRLISKLVQAGHLTSILTFNYDCGVEMGLWLNELDVDYGLDDGGEIPVGTVELLKLHGSLNWARCPDCGKLQAQRVRDTVNKQEADWRVSGPPRGPYCFLPFSPQLSGLKCPTCQHSLDGTPVIVPPTINKAGLHKELQPVWRKAANRLARAESLFIVGYSWPSTDSFFHQLYALGTVGSVILSRLWVCDPDEGVRRRFQTELLGQQALDCLGPAPEKRTYLFTQTIDAVAKLFNLGDAAEPSRRV